VQQWDALARQGIMSIARHAGQVWHAAARQLHRMVRHSLVAAVRVRARVATQCRVLRNLLWAEQVGLLNVGSEMRLAYLRLT
jgi:hypothetical protein